MSVVLMLPSPVTQNTGSGTKSPTMNGSRIPWCVGTTTYGGLSDRNNSIPAARMRKRCLSHAPNVSRRSVLNHRGARGVYRILLAMVWYTIPEFLPAV